MKTINKNDLLQKLDDVVEQHISDAVALFQNRNDEFLNKPSATGGWSIAQCLDHLNSYGHYYLPRMREKLGAAPPANAKGFTSTWMGAYFTKMMDPETGKRKYKAFKGHIPHSQLDSASVVREFIRQQEELLYLLRDGMGKDLDAIPYSRIHPAVYSHEDRGCFPVYHRAQRTPYAAGETEPGARKHLLACTHVSKKQPPDNR